LNFENKLRIANANSKIANKFPHDINKQLLIGNKTFSNAPFSFFNFHIKRTLWLTDLGLIINVKRL